MEVCGQIGIPVALDKTEWASETLVFLGILLDGKNFVLSIPLEKREKAVYLLKMMLGKNKAKVKELQSLCGYLNFLGKAIFPGRAFTRRMYAKYSKIINVKGTAAGCSENYQFKFKQHHHMRLDGEFKWDCEVWLKFLSTDLASVVNRPMIDLSVKPQASEIKFFSDASAGKELGLAVSSISSGFSASGERNLWRKKIPASNI